MRPLARNSCGSESLAERAVWFWGVGQKEALQVRETQMVKAVSIQK